MIVCSQAALRAYPRTPFLPLSAETWTRPGHRQDFIQGSKARRVSSTLWASVSRFIDSSPRSIPYQRGSTRRIRALEFDGRQPMPAPSTTLMQIPRLQRPWGITMTKPQTNYPYAPPYRYSIKML
jgi:hypothetical protein